MWGNYTVNVCYVLNCNRENQSMTYLKPMKEYVVYFLDGLNLVVINGLKKRS
jgi:hypothetical protein